MNFQIPQFIEQEAKILGPFTFKQTLWVVGVGIIIFFLYYSLAKTNPVLFIIITVFLAGTGSAFAFLKIHGYSLPVLLKNLFSFSFSSKIYLWKQVMIAPRIIPKKEGVKKEEKEEPVLKIAEKSQLKKLSSQIETMTK